jgi:lipoyl(octanoyl) transferase
MPPVRIMRLGLADYGRTWDLQRSLFERRLKGQTDDWLILCEHPHTYTVGRDGIDHLGRHLLRNREELALHGIQVFEIDRGGDITYHGPGQLVGYPILDLNAYYRDVHRYLRDLEETVIRTVGAFGIAGRRIDRSTGVWVDTPRGPEKICAIGVKVSRWITMHGFALNVDTDLKYFGHIVPCGISDKGVTSIQAVLERTMSIPEVEEELVRRFEEVFRVPTTRMEPEPVLS